MKTAQAFGLPSSFTRKTRLPFDVRGAIRFDDQEQFHPTKYVAGLAETIPEDGCHVFERSRVVDWDPTRVVTNEGRVAAKSVVMTTHLPLGQVGGFYAEAHPRADPMVVAPIGRLCISAPSSRAIPSASKTARCSGS